jgi:hypothetical protein
MLTAEVRLPGHKITDWGWAEGRRRTADLEGQLKIVNHGQELLPSPFGSLFIAQISNLAVLTPGS